VPKYEFIHEAGTPVSNRLKQILLQYFSEEDVQKLERLGGKVQFSITAPYISPEKRRASKAINVDSEYIKLLKEMKNDPDKLLDNLKNLTVKQLRELCKLVDQPVRSSATASEIRIELVRNFQSQEIWNRISAKK
jgi:hypothetical protein